MTGISKLVAWARVLDDPPKGTPAAVGRWWKACGQRLARQVIDAFDRAPALPCGHTVEACRDAEGSYLRIDGDTMDLESAHGFALAILRKIDERRAADEAEENQP